MFQIMRNGTPIKLGRLEKVVISVSLMLAVALIVVGAVWVGGALATATL